MGLGVLGDLGALEGERLSLCFLGRGLFFLFLHFLFLCLTIVCVGRFKYLNLPI